MIAGLPIIRTTNKSNEESKTVVKPITPIPSLEEKQKQKQQSAKENKLNIKI